MRTRPWPPPSRYRPAWWGSDIPAALHPKTLCGRAPGLLPHAAARHGGAPTFLLLCTLKPSADAPLASSLTLPPGMVGLHQPAALHPKTLCGRAPGLLPHAAARHGGAPTFLLLCTLKPYADAPLASSLTLPPGMVGLRHSCCFAPTSCSICASTKVPMLRPLLVSQSPPPPKVLSETGLSQQATAMWQRTVR